jgi:hypothetical protein
MGTLKHLESILRGAVAFGATKAMDVEEIFISSDPIVLQRNIEELGKNIDICDGFLNHMACILGYEETKSGILILGIEMVHDPSNGLLPVQAVNCDDGDAYQTDFQNLLSIWKTVVVDIDKRVGSFNKPFDDYIEKYPQHRGVLLKGFLVHHKSMKILSKITNIDVNLATELWRQRSIDDSDLEDPTSFHSHPPYGSFV